MSPNSEGSAPNNTIQAQYSPELVQAVGLMILTASATENALAIQLARLIAHPNKLDAPTVFALTGTETRVRLQQIKVLARCRLSSEKAPEVIDLCDKIDDCFARRNELAHFVNTPGSAPDRVNLRTPKLKANGSLVPMKTFTAEQIREFASTLHERVRRLDELLTQAGIVRL